MVKANNKIYTKNTLEPAEENSFLELVDPPFIA